MIGAASWNPPASAPDWLEEVDRPIVLVTCSTERQLGGPILQNALDGPANTDVFVVGTSAAQDPADFDVPANARVERFISHDPIVERAVAVVCHGGMGITQRALLHGVRPLSSRSAGISSRSPGGGARNGGGSTEPEESRPGESS